MLPVAEQQLCIEGMIDAAEGALLNRRLEQ
jgi:hypothetical protein